MAYQYPSADRAREKLSYIVKNLATGKQDIRSRFREVGFMFARLYERDFPSDLQERWFEIKNELYRPQTNHFNLGCYKANTLTRRNSSYQKIAEKVWSLREDIESRL